MAYLGSKAGADAFLADMGHVRNEDGNPAEFYLETVSLMRLDEKQGVLVPSRDYEQLHKAFEERRRLAGYQPISVDNRSDSSTEHALECLLRTAVGVAAPHCI